VKRILILTLMLLVVMLGTTAFGVQALLNDTETSTNTFTAGVLDLEIGGVGTAGFDVGGLNVGSQINSGYGKWICNNVGNIPGYLNICNITLTNQENGREEPEIEAGDTTGGNPGVGNGELQNLLTILLFVDVDGDGWNGAGDIVIYNGPMTGLPASATFDYQLVAGGSVNIQPVINWPNHDNNTDSQAMGDSVHLDITFCLTEGPNYNN